MTYRDLFGLHDLFDATLFHTNLALIGPKGGGKSLAVHNYAEKNQIPLVTIDCSEDTREHHLLGQYILAGDQTPFVEGPLVKALRTTPRCIVVFEELNALTPQVQKLLNPLTDWRRHVHVPYADISLTASPGQIALVATLNDASHGGTYRLNEDLRSRFEFVRVPYPTVEQERALLDDLPRPSRFLEQLLRFAHETRQPDSFQYALSSREVRACAEHFFRLGKKVTLQLLRGKFEADAELFERRAKAVFGDE